MTEAERTVHYSGILVLTDPARMDSCARTLATLAGVEVHHRYPERGRMIVVQESATIEEQEDGLRRIRALPDVRLAELVYHHVDEPHEESDR